MAVVICVCMCVCVCICLCVCACVYVYDCFLHSQIWQGMKCLLENYANAVRGNTKCSEIET